MKKIYYCIIILALVVIVSHINTFNNDFIFLDGYNHIIGDPAIKNLNLNKVFSIFSPSRELVKTKYLFYSPLHTLSLAVDYQLYGLNPRGYHITNTLLHLLACIAVFYFVLLLAKNTYVAFWTAVFFALHPVHVEAVTWINARFYPLAALFIFLSLIFYIKRNELKWAYPASIIFYICACLSHNSAIVLPALIFLYDINFEIKKKRDWPEKLKGYVPYIVVGLLLYGAFQYYGVGEWYRFENWKMMTAKIITRAAFPFSMLALPFSVYYVGYNFQGIWPPLVIEILKMCLLFLSFIAIFTVNNFYKKDRIKSFSILWIIIYLLPFLPMSIFERYLYIPSFGFCLLLACYMNQIRNQRLPVNFKVSAKFISALLCILISIFYFTATVEKNTFWRDSFTLSKRLLKYPDTSAHIIAGDFYVSRQQWEKAREEYLLAKNGQECTDFRFYYKLGDVYEKIHDPDKAKDNYLSAIDIMEKENLASRRGSCRTLAYLYKRAADLYTKSGNVSLAQEYLKKADRLERSISQGESGKSPVSKAP